MADDSKLFRDLFIGLVQLHVLWRARQESVYGLGIQLDLYELGYEVSTGTLYPLLHALQQAESKELRTP